MQVTGISSKGQSPNFGAVVLTNKITTKNQLKTLNKIREVMSQNDIFDNLDRMDTDIFVKPKKDGSMVIELMKNYFDFSYLPKSKANKAIACHIKADDTAKSAKEKVYKFLNNGVKKYSQGNYNEINNKMIDAN